MLTDCNSLVTVCASKTGPKPSPLDPMQPVMERSPPTSGRPATPADINRNGRPTSIGTGGRDQIGMPGRHHRNAHLELLPDEQIPAATAGLLFIRDAQLRESIRGDIAFANQAVSGGEWKAATVLAGAAAEALLLWAITEKKSPTDIENARAAVIPSAPTDPNRWDLDAYIKVARHLALIETETERLADLAREFRNLIHPGRSARLAKVCDRGTALSALAAVELIVRDLS